MRTHQWLKLAPAALLMLSLAACQPITAPSQTTNAAPTMLYVTFKAQDFKFEGLPQQIEAGLVEFNLENDGQEPHHAQFARLKDGVTMDQVMAAMQKDPDAALPLLEFVGGPGTIDPGTQQDDVIIDMKPGHYLVLCFVAGADNIPHLAKGMIAQLDVVEAKLQAMAPAPQADVEVKMLDFSYVLPQSIQAGEQVWKVSNEGTQPHELALLKLADGKTMDDVMAFFQKPAGMPPFTSAGGSQAVDPGTTGLVKLDLLPGNYIAMCNVPDPASHKSHAELGMMLPFTVQ